MSLITENSHIYRPFTGSFFSHLVRTLRKPRSRFHLSLIHISVNIVRRVLSVLMKHYHVGNGKAVSLKVFGVVDIETGINIFKGSPRRKGRGIDKLIVRFINHISRRLQAVVRLKAEVPCFVPALYLDVYKRQIIGSASVRLALLIKLFLLFFGFIICIS